METKKGNGSGLSDIHEAPNENEDDETSQHSTESRQSAIRKRERDVVRIDS